VDVGHGQIDQSLRTNSKVVNWEKTHVLSLTRTAFAEDIQFVVMDMSFISLRSVLAHVRTLLGGGVTVIPMVKPQFEVGAKNLKKGVVKSEAIAQAAVEDIIAFAKKEGFLYLNQTPAKIKGPKGNQEYFLYLKTS
jgi:23S rRNA (cytidine1920-2'-O)/16S rRNA (cytidine1409-2'-O)-methyltransferase